jgi:hypothetical protein
MSALLAVLAAAALSAASPATPAPKEPPTLVRPVTVTPQPRTAPAADVAVSVGAEGENIGGQDISIWPAGALESGAAGRVVLTCMVDVHGLAETCRVAYEEPQGKGFGRAALALRPTLKLTPRLGPDGRPVNASMNIAINFKPPSAESNLAELQANTGAVPPEAGDKASNLGEHELNARNLMVYHNPIAHRPLTLIDGPAWVQAPSFDDLDKAYPAAGGGVEGYVVAHCKAERTGALSRCAVAKELPVGHGFGKAALTLAPQFRLSPEAMAQAPAGAPVEVDVPIRFPPPAEAGDRTVRSPIWLAGYDPLSLIRQFPAALGKPDSAGSVVRCQVATDGSLTACATELTSPDGIDFDEAAVKLASRLRMNLWSGEAGPVEGGVVHIPVRRDLADGQQAEN